MRNVLFSRMKELFDARKKQLVLALAFFIIEVMLFVWPVGWIREDIDVPMDTGGMWLEQMTEEMPEFCQEFVPQYDNLQKIQLFFADIDQTLGDGEVSVSIADSENNILFQKVYSYSALTFNLYMDINLNLELQAGEPYYLFVAGHGISGEMPSLALRPAEPGNLENRELTRNGETLGGQVLMNYYYSDVLTRRGLLKALALCAFTALIMALGLPKNRKVQIALGIAALLVWPWVMGIRLERLSEYNFEMVPAAVKWSMILMYIIEVLILLYSLSLRGTIVVLNVLMTILYSANYFVYAYRGAPLKINDFTAIGTAVRVVGDYSFRPNHDLAIIWAIMAAFVVFGLQINNAGDGRQLKLRFHIAGAVLGLALTIGVGYWLLYTDFVFTSGFQNAKGIGANNIYQFNGYLIGTCMDIQKSRVAKPEGYSHERAEQILQEASAGADNEVAGEELPHVIVVMNESFSDLRVLGNLEISQENLTFFNSLSENTIRGYVNASTLGGGTANTEFEVFTGCSIGFLPASCYPYQQYVKKPMHSLISSMEEAGYTTWSIHPATKNNWSRVSVYQYFGFDNSLWVEDFAGAEIIHSGASDLETYHKVQEVFESRQPGEKMFIFDLTLQNHGGYRSDKVLEKTVTAVNVDSIEADTYLSLIQESDAAFEQLIHYFEQQDEKVIICMYGDHQPKFLDENFYNTIYAETPGLSEEDKQWNLYKTPFLIWANYDIEEAEGLELSMNYLGVFLQKTAGIPLTPYFSFLAKQMEDYPVISVNGYMDREGQRHAWSGDADEFPDYRILQYNYLFDKNIVKWGY